MSEKVSRVLVVVYSLSLLFSTTAQAIEDDTSLAGQADSTLQQCGGLIKECFAESGLQRTNCLFASAQHPFCEGSGLGKLTYKRWAMSPIHASGAEAPPALLGPQLVDTECLSKFDNQLSSMLIAGNVSEDVFLELNSSLDGCKKQLTNEMMRP